MTRRLAIAAGVVGILVITGGCFVVEGEAKIEPEGAASREPARRFRPISALEHAQCRAD
jgi:hypothetical protein